MPHQAQMLVELMDPEKPADPSIQDHLGPASNANPCFDSLRESS